ncbi:MAG: Uma2 family endonuclease [Fischerella sp.]|uniref:Uma2 family endonuclease n=1 Tax=Fischerella sp. TaxID=1191 RepID=UPI00179F50ED|nr:Uma2 family endonuclease [Fischerella sp.]NWF61061.1 Uma2 family endonuclease [Fischerella sp.]
MYQTDPPRSPKEVLPTMYNLKSEDPEEPGLPDEFHDLQPELLRLTFHPANYPADQIFIASDLNLYYDPRHPQWYKRPDWFAVLGVSRLYEQQDLRLSYVTWQEGVNPFVVVELLSPGTEKEDLGQTLREVNQPPTKWEVYEQILRVPYYFVFNRYTDELQAFGLITSRYQALPIEGQGVWLEEVQLGLGLWRGIYQDIERLWLRWYDATGDWIPTPAELAEQERQQKQLAQQQIEQERQRAEQERQRAEQLAARLRALGIDPDLP